MSAYGSAEQAWGGNPWLSISEASVRLPRTPTGKEEDLPGLQAPAQERIWLLLSLHPISPAGVLPF